MSIRRRPGFTLIDLMIVIVILGVLAAIVMPLVSHHMDKAQLTAAQSTLNAVDKAVELYWMKNNAYPATLEELSFQMDEPLTLPTGYEFTYDPLTGVVVLETP